MTTAQQLSVELQQQAAATRKVLERIPDDRLAWKPHEKSTAIGRLGMHLSELPGGITRTLATEEFDYAATPFKPVYPNSVREILDNFDKTLAGAVGALEKATDEQLSVKWRARRGDQIVSELPRGTVIRNTINHIFHHRGQMTVYLRLLDIPVPKTFGPTADER